MTPVSTRTSRGSGTGTAADAPADENARLSSADVEDPALNDIARLAAQLCRAPVAVISMIEAGGLRHRATFGISATEGGFENSPCDVALTNPGVYVIRDAATDPRHAPDGICLGQQYFRFYAGTPLITPEAAAIGTLCVLDHQTRTLDRAQADALLILARQVITRLELSAKLQTLEQEARARQRVDQALNLERNFVSAVLDTMGTLVIVFDTAGRVVRFNRACEMVSGSSFDELVGRPFWEKLVPEEDIPETIRIFSDICAGNVPTEFENRWVTGEGLKRISWTGAALRDARGEVSYIIATGIDITEKTRAEEALRVANRQVNTILESAGDGIVSLDPEGRITLINHAALDMLGYDSTDEILGYDAHALFHHSTREGTPIDIEECRIHNSIALLTTTRVSDEVFWRKNGTMFDAEYIACPQIDDGEPVGTTVLFQDVTERRALERMKDEFIATVSHELRTPLTSVRAALGLIAGGALHARPEKAQQMLDVAIGNTDRLVSLVNDILDLERMSAGKMQMHREDVRIDELLQRAADLQHSSVQKTGIQFRIDAEPVTAFVDSDRILQTLTNLVSNAIKFSPPGSHIRLIVRATGPNEVHVCVMDEGRGIPADKLETIFERFQQVDASDSRMMGGTGLGLAICRSIIEQHGGRIWAESTAGDGARFHFTLPRLAGK